MNPEPFFTLVKKKKIISLSISRRWNCLFLCLFRCTERQYSNLDELRTALEDGEIQGALIDTYVAAEHKESLLGGRVFVKKILDRPFGYGVVLSGAARNVELRCRDYINMKISDIFNIIQNMTETFDVSSKTISGFI